MEKTMVFDTNMTMGDFVRATEDIASHFFDENGNYVPHIGHMNAMRVFYNFCVKESEYDELIGTTVDDILDMKPIITDNDFLREFNTAIGLCEYFTYSFKLDFHNAYACAIDMVDTKKGSAEQMVHIVLSGLNAFMQQIGSYFNEENLDKLTTLAENDTFKQLLEAYINK